MRAAILILATTLPLVARGATAQQPNLTIRLANDSERERSTRDQLVRLLGRYDVQRWIETRDIAIEQMVTPHSHPVLTLSTLHLDDDLQLLSTFLHEQFHWYAIRNGERRDSAMAAFREHWPEVPVGDSEGARDEESTYLHFVVCDLEFQAMTILVGREEAKRVLDSYTHYEWIYDRVLEDPYIRTVMARNGLIVQ
ncbi:MAG: hypothetical protein PVH00_14010 [Gemmatimonadota bacterium]|jgi:hypothetical protein